MIRLCVAFAAALTVSVLVFAVGVVGVCRWLDRLDDGGLW